MKLKRSRGKISSSYLDVWRTNPSTSNHTSTHTCSQNELPHQLFTTSQFVCDLRFLLPTAAVLVSSNKQELCCFPSPPYQNVPNKASCCLLAFCLRINKGQEDQPLMSVYSVFGVFVCVFMCPALPQPAAAAHLHRGMGKLALVRGLQRGQRGDAAEDHSIQRTHRLSHHQGCAAQWCPETGKASFYGLTAFLCLFWVIIPLCQQWLWPEALYVQFCRSILLDVHPIFINSVFQKCIQIWHSCLLGLKDEFISFWWSKFTVTLKAITQEFMH